MSTAEIIDLVSLPLVCAVALSPHGNERQHKKRYQSVQDSFEFMNKRSLMARIGPVFWVFGQAGRAMDFVRLDAGSE
jgi:hypothetical protein